MCGFGKVISINSSSNKDMSNAQLWNCLKCAGKTARPKILRGRRGGWVVKTVCQECGSREFSQQKSQLGRGKKSLASHWKQICENEGGPSYRLGPLERQVTPHGHEKRPVAFALTAPGNEKQHRLKSTTL